MKRALFCAGAIVLAASLFGAAADFGPIILGVHFIPGVEATEEGRLWDFSISFGVGITFDGISNAEIHVVTDSHATSLGVWGHYQGQVNEGFAVGAGGTILWPIVDRATFLKPVIETYARAEVQWDVGPLAVGCADISFPILTMAQRGNEWEIIPFAGLPSISLGGAMDFADDAALQGRLTLQPIITDTTLLNRPIGRLTDRLLVLPAISSGVRYMP